VEDPDYGIQVAFSDTVLAGASATNFFWEKPTTFKEPQPEDGLSLTALTLTSSVITTNSSYSMRHIMGRS
jgi:hypothetical protein